MRVIDAVTYIGVAGTFIGIPLAYVFARRGRQRPDLRCAYDFDVLIEPQDAILEQLVMKFNDVPISSVSRTVVAIWNARGDTVRGEDVVEKDPLRLQLGAGDTALTVRLTSFSRPQIAPLCRIDASNSDRALLTFDFLDAGDGFLVEILHTKPRPALVVGTIRGAQMKRVSKFSTALTSEALDAVAAPAYRRPLEFLGPGFAAFVMGVLCVPIAVLVAIGAYLIKPYVTKPHLANSAAFDLHTVDGQTRFVQAVHAAGNLERHALLLYIFVGVCALGLYIIYRVMMSAFRPIIPPSIVRIRREQVTELGEAPESNKPDEPKDIQPSQPRSDQADTPIID